MSHTYTTKWAKTCAERVESGTLTEPEIRRMRGILRDALDGRRRGYRVSSCTPEDADALVQLLWDHPVQVSAEQARKGVEWLHGAAYTPKGKRRATEASQEFTEIDLTVLAQCKASPRFSLVDIDQETFAPVYRCHGADGAYFDYIAAAWQSGGQFQITDRN